MSLYDDLGVRPGASPEEIREQCRVLVRLLHPDRFVDPVLKGAAESQLRRFQEIEAVLTDPERRREHDHLHLLQLEPAPARVPWSNVAWGVAALFCAMAVFWVSSAEPVPTNHAPVEKVRMITGAGSLSAEEWRARARAAIAERDQALKELARFKIGFVPKKMEEAAVAPVPHPGFADSLLAAASARRFEGIWSYKRHPGALQKLYVPEYIETQITEQQGHLRGRYRARYQGPEKSIPPSVNFDFSGEISGGTGRIPFVREDGVQGEVQLRLLSEHQLELAWTMLSALPNGLSSGTAVLVKTE